MRLHAVLVGVALSACLASGPVLAKPSPQSTHCSANANSQGLTGSRRTAYRKICMRGPLAAQTPTAPTGSSQESQAVTKPSGVDRTTRTKQCAAEADKKKLAGKDRSAFQLSCLATAGPVSEGETGTVQPHPANAIKGIGVNNNAPGAPPAKSTPKP